MKPTTGTLCLGLALLLVAAGTSSFALAQDTPDSPDLDLREANVVGVEFENETGTYDFSVTLFHDDDGESGYADWWQVETLNGSQLGRRDLLHAHGTEPFTRSTRVEIPANVSLVVVRGHDQTHGYGGQAMVVDLRTGATEMVQQGPEARDFGECEVVELEKTTLAAETTATATATTNETTMTSFSRETMAGVCARQ